MSTTIPASPWKPRTRVARAIVSLTAATAVAVGVTVVPSSARPTDPPATKAAALTSSTPLENDRLGPIRIGMTLAEARRVSGQPLPYVNHAATPRCGAADVQPRSLGVSLGVLNGVVAYIQLRRSPIRVRGGGRIGDSLAALRHWYGASLRRDHVSPHVRTLTRGNHRILFSVYEGHPVDVITAGRRPAIDWNALCD